MADRTQALISEVPQILGLEYGDFTLLAGDFESAGCSAAEYIRRIGGPNNIRGYVDCLRVQRDRDRAAIANATK